LPLLSALDRPIFFPQIFALPNQHPLAVLPALKNLQHFQRLDPKFFDGGDEVGGPLTLIRTEISLPENLPPTLGPKPEIFVYVLTMPGEPLSAWRDAKLMVKRDRYALFKLTNLEDMYSVRRQYWHMGEEHPRPLVAASTRH
jgi:hypothetical protein